MKGRSEIARSGDTPNLRKPAAWWGLFLLAVIPYAALAGRLWFLTDDAFISFRYARNWTAGLGLRFNPMEEVPVEGFSNFLWTALLAGLDLLGLDMVLLANWLSTAAALVLLYLVFRSLRFDLGASPGAVFLGLLCAALSPAYAAWSSGGLETMLFALLLFLAFRYLLARPKGPDPLFAGFAAGLAALTRPEGMIWALCLAFLLPVAHRGMPLKVLLRKAGLYLLAALVLFLPYLVARWLYFGYPMPNTFYAKSVWGLVTLERGFNYTMSYLICFGTPLLLLLAFPLCLRKGAPSAGRAACLVWLGFLCYSILSGGDFMAFGRFMAPAAPYMAWTAACLLDRYVLRRGQIGQVLTAAAVLAILVQALPAFGAAPVPDAVRRAFHFRWNSPVVKTELDQWRQMRRNLSEWKILGRCLRDVSGPETTYVSAAIGAVGYYSDLTIYDACGLVDLEVARRSVPAGERRSAGHDKYVEPEFFLQRRPNFLRAILVSSRQRTLVEEDYARTLPPGYAVDALGVPPRLADGRSNLVVVVQRREE
jgi:hypothetical protein